jgi:Family of unknown function (DUF6874)
MIDWDKISNEDVEICKKIAARAVNVASANEIRWDFVDATMDIAAAHIDCPMDLSKLLTAPDSDFGHDVFGIRRFLNRQTGELTEFFTPRCSTNLYEKSA